MCTGTPVDTRTNSRRRHVESSRDSGTAPAPGFTRLLMEPFNRHHRFAELRGRLLDKLMTGADRDR